MPIFMLQMCIRKSIVYFVLLALPGLVHAQNCGGNGRYLQRVFPQVTRTANIQFATVQTLPAVYINETQTISQNLYLDVFQPTGDTLQKRPLVILAFGGAFLIGTKDDADIQAACDSLAHLGYVTASIQYRLGLNPTNSASGERAVYRAAQDYSAAVRFFKHHAATYRIDTSAIFVGGASAGSFAALHMAYGEDDERPASTYASGGLFPAPDLGCFDCSGNNYAYSHKVRGLLNMWGAIGYLDWIEPNDPPIVSFHGDMDPLVPYSQGYPFTAGATLPYVYGSAKITERMQELGIYNEFYTYQSAIHQLWGGASGSIWAFGPTEFQQPILNGIRLFLYKQLKPTYTQLSGPDVACTGTTAWYSVPYRTGFRYCWQVQNGQVLQQNNNQLHVKWNTAGTGQISVREFNHMDFPADSALVKTVTVYPTPQVTIVGATSICAGEQVSLFAEGADHYTWTPITVAADSSQSHITATPTHNTVYTATGYSTDNCSSSAQVSVQVIPLPIAPFITKQDSILYVPEQYQTYQWFLNGVAIPNATANTVVIHGNGTYTVQVGQGLGCFIFSYPYSIQSAAIAEWNSNPVSVFPNPFEAVIVISGLPAGKYHGRLHAITGQVLHTTQFVVGATNTTLAIPEYPSGVYILTLENAQGEMLHYRLVRR